MTTVDLVEAPVVGLSFGLDLLDSSGVFVADITTDLVGDGSTVARRADNTIHGTCQLVIARQLLWGSARVRPWVEVSAEGETTTRWNLGVYALMTPARNAGEVPETFTVTGYDLLSHLNTPYGSTFAAAVSAVPLTLIATMLTAAGITNAIDQTAIGSVLATAMVWPLDEKNTTLAIINELLALIGYGPLWLDRDGRARSRPLDADDPTVWAYSADSATTTVGESRTLTADYWGVPNRWVFVRNGTTAVPSEGAGIYTVDNLADGPASQAGRGRIIIKPVWLDAVSQTALVSQGDAIVAADKRVVSAVSFAATPNPEHWHNDRVTFTDAALSLVASPFRLVGWSLPLNGGDMTLELEATV